MLPNPMLVQQIAPAANSYFNRYHYYCSEGGRVKIWVLKICITDRLFFPNYALSLAIRFQKGIN